MRLRRIVWVVACLLLLAGAWLLWRGGNQTSSAKKIPAPTIVTAVHSSSTAPNLLRNPTVAASVAENATATVKTNPFAYRLSNTTKTVGQLAANSRAILLENALIDTRAGLDLAIPEHLRSHGDAGAYIVQASGPITPAFRGMLVNEGGQIISYIPNNAYLVKISAGGANQIKSVAGVQSVIPYEPYYKIQSSLLGLAVENQALPQNVILNLGLFAGGAQQTISQIENLGGRIISQSWSPFGPVVRVQAPRNWTALAGLPGVQIVEPFRQRVLANDLSRASLGVAADTQVPTNYMFLSGSNVIVAVNDTGIDTNHPDFKTGGGLPLRIIGDPASWIDTDAHGTHVAGIIAGDGTESLTVTNAQGSIMPATNGQFRGMAPLAVLLAEDYNDDDQFLQGIAAETNALISNNSWNFPGDSAYDLGAASYDAATRDALPFEMGSQPVLFVFSAGNDGGGNDGGGGGHAETILSPATAKDVITVGALEQLRNITNEVQTINSDGTTNSSAVWQPKTDSSFQVANFSSRGNVGINVEGVSGRFKPDVVAPGTFVVSTRSADWKTNVYYNPTNDHVITLNGFLQPTSWTDPPLQFFAFDNAVEITITAFAGGSGSPFLPMPIYLWTNSPSPILAGTNTVNIPPDVAADLSTMPLDTIWQTAASNTTPALLPYTLSVDVKTTNDLGNYYEVLQDMNDHLGTMPEYYRYESGTSMSAADVSGVLALMADYFTNRLQLRPSPALLKALLINGSRLTGDYTYGLHDTINYEGWGQVSLPNSIPMGLTNQPGVASASFFIDQSPTNALATGDTQTYYVTIDTNNDGIFLPLQVTVAWTDPPGNPAAAIKLVNNLDLVVSNMDTGDTYFGNDISSGAIYNNVWATNMLDPTNLVGVADNVNNVEQVIIPPLLSGHYAVMVIGKDVNVNAVTAQTNDAAGNFAPNTVQDYALVVSCGEGEVPDAMTVTNGGVVSASPVNWNVTVVTTTNAPLFNQFVGASSPLINPTNQISVGTNNSSSWNANGQITLGETNQWHFYIVTNNGAADFTNAAFITFLPDTLSIPRMGVFESTVGNATRPEADIDLYVARSSVIPNASDLINLDSTVIAEADKSLTRGGTEFVAYTNTAPGEVFYIGVKSEDQMASEYAFIPIISNIPFGQTDSNGNQTVNGLPAPVNIPDGDNAHPGIAYTFALALTPAEVGNIILTNVITHQNFGDLVGTLTHGDTLGGNTTVILNSHEEINNPLPPGPYTNVFDQNVNGPLAGSQPADGPGSLENFLGQQALGVWIMSQADNSQSQTGSIQSVSMFIEKHPDLSKGIHATIGPTNWFYTFIDVPAGVTNLTVNATNTSAILGTFPLEMVIKFGSRPVLTNADKGPVFLTNGSPPGNSLSVGPTDVPPIQPGRYWVGIWNSNTTSQDIFLIANLSFGSGENLDFGSTGSSPILDDAVSDSSTIFVATNLPVASLNVGIEVQHPRISDLMFHLISPQGTRVLLMEQRGGSDANGAGISMVVTNVVNVATNIVTVTTNIVFVTNSIVFTNSFEGNSSVDYTSGQSFSSGWTVGTNQVSLMTDTNAVYNGTNFLALANGSVATNLNTIPGQTYTVSFAYRGPGAISLWRAESNALDSVDGNDGMFSGDSLVGFTNGFENASMGDYTLNQVVAGFTVKSNQVSLIADPTLAYHGSNFVALANGTLSTNFPTVVGQTYTLSFAYRGPGIAGWWRGESNFNDSVYGNNGIVTNGTVTFTNAEVANGFNFDGNANRLVVPFTPTLNFKSNADLSIDGWIGPLMPPPFETTGINAFVDNRYTPNSTICQGYEFGLQNGKLYFHLSDNIAVGGAAWGFTGPDLRDGNMHYVAVSVKRNSTTGGHMYIDGAQTLQFDPTAYSGDLTPSPAQPLRIGNHSDAGYVSYFNGRIDEVSIYRRALSASEIKAIYQANTIGKYDPIVFNTSPAQSLAEVQAKLNGQALTNVFGNNTNWQIYTTTFVATTNQTLFSLSGFEPGVLLDDVALTTDAGNYANGEVGIAFKFNGANTVAVPRSTSLSSPSNEVTIDFWMNANSNNLMNTFQGLLASDFYWISLTRGFQPRIGVNFGISTDNGASYAEIANANGGGILVSSNAWHHIAGVYNGSTVQLYIDGQAAGNPIFHTGAISPMPVAGYLSIGSEDGRSTCSSCYGNRYFNGLIDEATVYNRALSLSELKAIYNLGGAGKFDPAKSFSTNLAEINVSLTNQTVATVFGSNTTWQTYSTTFTATTNKTPFKLTGIEPGMLVDFFVMPNATITTIFTFVTNVTSSVLVTNIATNIYYLTFTEDTNLTQTPIKYAEPAFVPSTLTTNISNTSFEGMTSADYTVGGNLSGWNITSNQVSLVTDPTNAYDGSNFVALASGVISNTLPTIAGKTYILTFAYRGPGAAGMWRGESNILDFVDGNTGSSTNGVAYTNGEVGSAFELDGTNGYVEVPAATSLDVGNDAGMSVDCWINPTDASLQMPLVEWTGGAPTKTSPSIVSGPVHNPMNGHYYYVLSANNWSNAEAIAQTLDGHLVTINDAVEDGWVATNVMLTGDNPWIGLQSPSSYLGPYTWVNGETATYRNFASGEPNGVGSPPWGVNYFPLNDFRGSGWQGKWNDAPKSDAVQSIVEVGEPGVQFWISVPAPDGSGAGCLFANLRDTNNVSHTFSSAAGTVQPGSYQHVALTYNRAKGDAALYYNGAVVATTNFGTLDLETSGDVSLGDHYPNPTNYVYSGSLDEISVYGRNLSTSEINAIYQKGSAGKFDAGIAAPQNFAEAQIELNGQTAATIVGSNTVWQTKTITFTATQNGTPVQISGVEPGILLDDFTLTQVPGNLYYFPEQSLDAFTGENAYGDWTLEIQDARTGASLMNALLSWELQIIFADTNAAASSLIGGIGQSNQFIPTDQIAWYQVNVPASATFATNLLLFASAPLNVWWSTNVPPSITNIDDVDLIPDSTGNTGSPAILSTNTSPAIVPGGTYYLGVQNTNGFTVNYGLEVDFDKGNGGSSSGGSLIISSISVSGSATTLNWTASPSAQFQIQWTDDLTQPWNTDSQVITSSDGNFTFTDDGSQTAPLGVQRYYRLVQIAP